MTGDDVFEKQIMGRLRKDFKSVQETRMIACSLDNESNGSMTTSTVGDINVHQNVAIDELQEITFDKYLQDVR